MSRRAWVFLLALAGLILGSVQVMLAQSGRLYADPAGIGLPSYPQPAPALSLAQTTGVAVGQDQTVELLHQTGGSTNGVVVRGTYAYAFVGPRLAILDVTKPAHPRPIGHIDLPGGPVAGTLDVQADYAYSATGSPGLSIIDVSNLGHPLEVGFFATPAPLTGVAVVGRHAYVTHNLDGSGGYLRILDVADPEHPAEVGVYRPDPAEWLWDVALAGDRAYLAAGNVLEVVDVSDPAGPVRLGVCDTLGQVEAVAVAGSWAYTAGREGGLCVVDVADPAHPTQAGCYTTDEDAEDVAVAGRYAYVAAGSAGLVIVDVADPAHPAAVAAYNTPGEAILVAVAGSHAYVADRLAGL